jgi:anti-sigma B factor antagonist
MGKMRPPLVREEGDILLITLDDPVAVNEGQAYGLRQLLYGKVEALEAPKVAIDLGAIDYISSTGIALLIGLKRRIEARQGRLALFHLRGEVLELFALMKLASLFVIVPDQEKAFNLLRSPSLD